MSSPAQPRPPVDVIRNVMLAVANEFHQHSRNQYTPSFHFQNSHRWAELRRAFTTVGSYTSFADVDPHVRNRFELLKQEKVCPRSKEEFSDAAAVLRVMADALLPLTPQSPINAASGNGEPAAGEPVVPSAKELLLLNVFAWTNPLRWIWWVIAGTVGVARGMRTRAGLTRGIAFFLLGLVAIVLGAYTLTLQLGMGLPASIAPSIAAGSFAVAFLGQVWPPPKSP